MCTDRSLWSDKNWFLNQFVEIPWRSIIVCYLSLSANAGLNLPPFEISCSWPPPLYATLVWMCIQTKSYFFTQNYINCKDRENCVWRKTAMKLQTVKPYNLDKNLGSQRVSETPKPQKLISLLLCYSCTY
jgi:hypothetical protein